MEKNKFYLVGNAHLDPIWQWRWQEGSMEAKATLRSALDRMVEFPEFRFVCSSASVFQWVEEFAPEMLQEIKERVKEGRFVIVGGWHVQPDCNLPCGESFARQALYAQNYFHKTFGVTATVGYCVDTFGHTATLPMLLKNGGMDSYIFMRPSPSEKKMESDVFNWYAPDGSSVLTYRILSPYSKQFNDLEMLEERIEYLNENTNTNLPVMPVFYGVGNHGGGPTIRHLEVLREYKKLHPEKELVYSSLRDFFDDVKVNFTVPDYYGELQHHASGCYAAESRVKNGVRRAECDLSAAENYAFLTNRLLGKQINNQNFHSAWDAVCFCHFHDSMGGCSIRQAHEDTLDMLGMAKYTAAVEENNALQTLSWQIDTTDRTLGQPLVLFNPYSFSVTATIQVNGDLNKVIDVAGTEIPSQLVLSPTKATRIRDDLLFSATVEPFGYKVYYLDKVEAPKTYEGSATASYKDDLPKALNPDGAVLENEFYRIVFEGYSGYITSFVDKQTDQELITDKAAVPFVYNEYHHDTWSHNINTFTDKMARFSDAKVTVLENGPIRSAVKVVSRYNDSYLTQVFYLNQGDKKLYVRASVDWREKHKLLKLNWPMNVENPKAYYEIPFGVIERPTDNEEESGINWTAVKGTNGGFALINNNTYSSSVDGATICQTVVRSPIFSDHGGPRTDESEFTSQGITEFEYQIMPVGDNWHEVIKAGKVLNKGLTYILDTWHNGHLPNDSLSALKVDRENVIVSAIKRSEDNKGIIIRLYETDGLDTEYAVSGKALPLPLSKKINAWSVDTWYLEDNSTEWQKVDFTEIR